MKEYSQPETRIRVETSQYETKYWPEYKSRIFGWLGFELDPFGDEVLQIRIKDGVKPKDVPTGSEIFAKLVIDKYLHNHKQKYMSKLKDKSKKETTHITYP